MTTSLAANKQLLDYMMGEKSDGGEDRGRDLEGRD